MKAKIPVQQQALNVGCKGDYRHAKIITNFD